jgi:choline-phosphate cytidylyltransferase
MPRVYADGIYDLFHHGHALQLQQAKEALPGAILVVGVCGDALTWRHKGPTVLTERERYEIVRHCRWVDEVIEDAPWIVTPEFLAEHRIDYVAHDPDPYPHPETGEDLYGWIKASGRFLPTRRTDGISTTDIIARVLERREAFARRNARRSHG